MPERCGRRDNLDIRDIEWAVDHVAGGGVPGETTTPEATSDRAGRS